MPATSGVSDTLIARLVAHNLIAGGRRDAAAEVSRFGALQAQDVRSAIWAIGTRLSSTRAREIQAALDRGDILRTHLFRGTWHMVSQNDIAWLTALVAEPLIAKNQRRYKQLGLDEPTRNATVALFAEAVCSARFKTRDDLAQLASAAGVDVTGQRLPYMLQYAELRGTLCSGPLADGRQTYALVSERAPHARAPRDDDLNEIARRYRQTRGGAVADDFVWWSGLPAKAARAAFEQAAPPIGDAQATLSPPTHALPAFDPYLIDYKHRGNVLDPRFAKAVNAGGGMMAPFVLKAGRVVGTWRHPPASRTLTITPFAALSGGDKTTLREAATRFVDFWAQDDVDVVFGTPPAPL